MYSWGCLVVPRVAILAANSDIREVGLIASIRQWHALGNSQAVKDRLLPAAQILTAFPRIFRSASSAWLGRGGIAAKSGQCHQAVLGRRAQGEPRSVRTKPPPPQPMSRLWVPALASGNTGGPSVVAVDPERLHRPTAPLRSRKFY